MMDRAIIATDLSEASDIIVKHLSFLKDFGVQSMLLLQCPDYQEVASEVFPYIATIQTEAIERQKEVLEGFGFTVEARISPGNAKREINRIAEEEGFPLVVVGSQGRSLVGGAFLGGVAHEVMLGTRQPLLIVRLAVDDQKNLSVIGINEQKVTQHILFATDFSPGAQGVSLYLEQLLATGTVKEVTLLHVQDRSRIEPHLVDRIDEFNKTDKERLQELKGRLEAGSDVSVTPKLVYGDPHTEVMREITESGATMVMMGTQGRGFFKELFVGSVSQFVARRSPIPVLLIPLPAESS
ncbi:MAG: universal stress protein [Sphaerochaetaceae bacterium]|jgi:nucleotide-binding universal stress UspA family protein|nr:universal stress protein [Sphaerochaetaceae bacterium]MDY0372082.1 universal stress protein [Sphaerochaetaceae bacterium]